MPDILQKRTAIAALALAVTLSTPAMAQSESNAGGGVQSASKQSPADNRIARQVYDNLSADKVDYYKHVTVSADHGVVTLGGSVATTEALNKAKKIASGVPGVTKVIDQMTLERPPSNPSGS
jgi:hyperosmotically inducible periplasmic protein